MFGNRFLGATAVVFALLSTAVNGKDVENPSSSQVRRKLTFDGKIPEFELYNADKDTKIMDLKDGTMVYLTDIPDMSSPSFNIKAVVSGSVRSTVFSYDGSKYRTEELAPYAFCGNDRTDYFKCRKLGCGAHTVSAVPYSRGGGRGESGPRYTVSFTIVCPVPTAPVPAPTTAPVVPVPAPKSADPAPAAPAPTAAKLAITGLALINADKDTTILNLANGTVVKVTDIPDMTVPSFNTNASYTGPVVSVVYWYNGTKDFVEVVHPFAFCANNRGDFFSCRKLKCGTHTVTAVPYPRSDGQGVAGDPYTVTFSIDCSSDAPVAPPIPAPVAPPKSFPQTAAPSRPDPCLLCAPSNGCFSTTCVAGKCVYTPLKTCPAGQGCEPTSGTCFLQDVLRPCVCVIDENSNFFDEEMIVKWDTFRATYPQRPFCLLQPLNSNYGEPSNNYGLFLPPKFLNDSNAKNFNITREDQAFPVIPKPPLADWFDLCDIDVFAATGLSFVGLFIDTSGSMTATTVQNMTATFIQKLNQSGLAYKTLFNDEEDWITPFLTDLSTL